MIQERNGKLWVVCPCCNLSLYQIWPETKVSHFPIYCKRCKKVVDELNI